MRGCGAVFDFKPAMAANRRRFFLSSRLESSYSGCHVSPNEECAARIGVLIVRCGGVSNRTPAKAPRLQGTGQKRDAHLSSHRRELGSSRLPARESYKRLLARAGRPPAIPAWTRHIRVRSRVFDAPMCIWRGRPLWLRHSLLENPLRASRRVGEPAAVVCLTRLCSSAVLWFQSLWSPQQATYNPVGRRSRRLRPRGGESSALGIDTVAHRGGRRFNHRSRLQRPVGSSGNSLHFTIRQPPAPSQRRSSAGSAALPCG